MPSNINARNIPSDSDPEIVRLARAKNTNPSFIERPGFVRCPRCQRCWPEDHFHPGRDESVGGPLARCKDCRDGLKRTLRQAAREQSICEAYSCCRPVVRKYKCAEHYRLSCEAHTRPAGSRRNG